jgi:hypothetical protein
MNKSISTKADYGIDAPPVIRNLLLIGMASVVAGIVLRIIFASTLTLLSVVLLIWGFLAGASMVITAALMIWSSKVGELQYEVITGLNQRMPMDGLSL